LKKLLDSERAKVAKYENEENSNSLKLKSVTATLEKVKLDLAQTKKLKDEQQRKLNNEKTTNQKKIIELEEKQKFNAQTLDKKDYQLKNTENEAKAARQETDVLQQELIALQAELELLRQTEKAEKNKLESFHKSLLQNKIEELTKCTTREIQLLKGTLYYMIHIV